jgi:aspartyl-tRNA(Asn)/glutamyl-tRNA(Gln) amidotransferase subunit A
MASSMDTIGCLTRNVTDHALVMNVMAGSDPLDATTPEISVPDYTSSLTPNIKGLKVGVPKEYFAEGTVKGVRRLTEEAIKKMVDLGAEVREISLPHTKYGVAVYAITCHSEVSSNLPFLLAITKLIMRRHSGCER